MKIKVTSNTKKPSKDKLNDYKGIHHDTKNKKYQDKLTGAHFEYKDMCRKLSALLKEKATASIPKEDEKRDVTKVKIQVLKDQTNNPKDLTATKLTTCKKKYREGNVEKIVIHKVQKSALALTKNGIHEDILEKTWNEIKSKCKTKSSIITKENKGKLANKIKIYESLKPKLQSGGVKVNTNGKDIDF